jgi:hypothetical protein
LEAQIFVASREGDIIESSDTSNPNLQHEYFSDATSSVLKNKFTHAKVLVEPSTKKFWHSLDELESYGSDQDEGRNGIQRFPLL